MLATGEFTDTLRNQFEDGRQVLDGIDAWHAERAGDEEQDGFGFRRKGVRLVVKSQHGSLSRFLVRTRWLRRSGLHFVHGGFLHEGLKCTVSLPLSPNETMDVPGTVAVCRHVTGRVHEIEMVFKEELHGAVFRLMARSRTAKPLKPDEIRSLGGSVLNVDTNGGDYDTLAKCLSRTQVSLLHASTGGKGIDILKNGPVDAVICDMDLSDLTGEQFIERATRRCKEAGFIVLTSVDDKARLQAAVGAGATDILFKPFSEERLFAALGKLLPRVELPEDEVVIDFRELEHALTDFTSALNRRDFEAVLSAAKGVHDFAVSASRGPLAEVSDEAVEALSRARTIAGTTPLLERLVYEAQEALAEAERAAAGGE